MGLTERIKKGLIFIVSGPAGVGKTTLVERLIKEYPAAVARSISCTTRAMRPHEKEGKDYFYMSDAEFKKKIHEGAFLEYAEVFGKFYGTLKESVEAVINSGKHVFLVIDTQGAMNLKSQIKATFIFVRPPSLQELEKRLKRRATDAEDKIKERLSWANDEINKAKYYDYTIINDHLEDAYQELKSLVQDCERRYCF